MNIIAESIFMPFWFLWIWDNTKCPVDKQNVRNIRYETLKQFKKKKYSLLISVAAPTAFIPSTHTFLHLLRTVNKMVMLF